MVNNKNLQKLSWYRRSGYSYLVLYIWYEKPAQRMMICLLIFWEFKKGSLLIHQYCFEEILMEFFVILHRTPIVKRIKAYVLREGTGEYFFTNCRIFFSVERCCTCIYVQQKEAHFSPYFEHKSKLEIDKLCL